MTVCQIFLNVIHKTNQNVHFCRRIHLICALLQYWATWCRHSRGGSSNRVLGKGRALLYRQGKSTHLGQSLPPTLPRPKTLKYSRTETLLYSYTKTLYRIPTPRHCCSIHALQPYSLTVPAIYTWIRSDQKLNHCNTSPFMCYSTIMHKN